MLFVDVNKRQKDHALADTDTENQHYGTATFENIDHDVEDASPDDNNNGSSIDDDEGSTFPSLTSVFSPDGIDWKVLRIRLLYLTAYALVAIMAYCLVFDHWTVIDALYCHRNIYDRSIAKI